MLYQNLAINDAGHLTFAGYDTALLAEQYGTPLMLLDEAVIRNRCRIYKKALAESFPAGSMPLYASKALSFKRMYEIMAQEGMGVDVVSIGELYTALKAGFPMENVYFHGNNKTDYDIRFAIENRIGFFICDNMTELDEVDREAARQGVVQKVLLRLTPGIDPHTHEKINTGSTESKFGAALQTGQAEELVVRALSKTHIQLCGYHCHIGSQIFNHTPFCDAAVMMLEFANQIRQKYDYTAQVINLGGGMGVPYTENDPTIDYDKNIRNIGILVADICHQYNMPVPVILMEPGRSIVADAGLTIYTVGTTKYIPGYKNYVSVDGGMADNPRYALYEAQYTIHAANRMHSSPEILYTVGGRCCESGDLIQEDVLLPELQRGDFLAVLTTGAYNYSMASNYNRLTRPAVVMLGKDGPYTAVRQESLEDLIANDL